MDVPMATPPAVAAICAMSPGPLDSAAGAAAAGAAAGAGGGGAAGGWCAAGAGEGA